MTFSPWIVDVSHLTLIYCELLRLTLRVEVRASCFINPGYCHTHLAVFPKSPQALSLERSAPTVFYILGCEQSKTFFFYISCSIHIPVDTSCSTVWTDPMSDRQIFYQRVLKTAMATQLTRWKESPDFYQLSASVS